MLYGVPFLFPKVKRLFIDSQNVVIYGVHFLYPNIKRLFPIFLTATGIGFCSQNGMLYSVPFLFPHITK